MPLYRCTTPAGTLDDERRQAIARAITTIHCDVTGAPPTFVHVQFFDGPEATIHGGIRAGRDAALTDRLVDRCVREVGAIAGVGFSMRTSTTNASWIFEGGRVFPEPGQEAAWLEQA
ncbi:MAG: tautomerase family protein [Acidimicrobiia bacterium]